MRSIDYGFRLGTAQQQTNIEERIPGQSLADATRTALFVRRPTVTGNCNSDAPWWPKLSHVPLEFLWVGES